MIPRTRSLDRLPIPLPPSDQLLRYGLVLNVQLVAVVLYYSFSGLRLTEPRYVLFGLLWIDVGLLAVRGRSIPSGIPFRTRRRALAVATAYFGLLAVTGGLVGTGIESAGGLRVAWLTPGWGPALVYAGSTVSFVLMPAYVVGYTALAYLVYAALLETTRSAVGGVLGLLSCVSCTWPVVAAVGSTFVGGAGFLSTSAMQLSYDLSTAVFLATVALLYWRPGFGD
ncbi:DUF7546 family protein [Natronomonas salina]|uniref:DUF7546 family protein n=1 Tax=Natronomonas salina TaxID=1710540 RepID=UPI001BA7B38E|nr:hypothetical protein [Natronomonas salina]